MQESASFWTDIKNLEAQLASSPDSLCFARLSEIYLKVGLTDDALHVARQGVLRHPRYLSGLKAFALACHAGGLNDDSLTALQMITEALPEDTSSQKLLGRLLSEAGNYEAASQAFRTALEFAPDDVECRIELESLERSAGITETTFESCEDEEEIIEDLEILEELDIIEEDYSETESHPLETTLEPVSSTDAPHDPLSTGTLAELYVAQGFIHKALDIYRTILTDNPADRATAERVAELEALESGPAEVPSVADFSFEQEDEEVSVVSALPEVLSQQAFSSAHEIADEPVGKSLQASADPSGNGRAFSELPSLGIADNALATLGRWLENIGRIKSCR